MGQYDTDAASYRIQRAERRRYASLPDAIKHQMEEAREERWAEFKRCLMLPWSMADENEAYEDDARSRRV